MRWRTPLAAVTIVASLVLYVFAASLLADFLPDSLWIKTTYYVFAGIAWLPPVIWIIGWTAADPEVEE